MKHTILIKIETAYNRELAGGAIFLLSGGECRNELKENVFKNCLYVIHSAPLTFKKIRLNVKSVRGRFYLVIGRRSGTSAWEK